MFKQFGKVTGNTLRIAERRIVSQHNQGPNQDLDLALIHSRIPLTSGPQIFEIENKVVPQRRDVIPHLLFCAGQMFRRYPLQHNFCN